MCQCACVCDKGKRGGEKKKRDPKKVKKYVVGLDRVLCAHTRPTVLPPSSRQGSKDVKGTYVVHLGGDEAGRGEAMQFKVRGDRLRVFHPRPGVLPRVSDDVPPDVSAPLAQLFLIPIV